MTIIKYISEGGLLGCKYFFKPQNKMKNMHQNNNFPEPSNSFDAENAMLTQVRLTDI